MTPYLVTWFIPPTADRHLLAPCRAAVGGMHGLMLVMLDWMKQPTLPASQPTRHRGGDTSHGRAARTVRIACTGNGFAETREARGSGGGLCAGYSPRPSVSARMVKPGIGTA